MGETFAGIASSGPLLLAILVSAAAGLVSFLSPCILPLVPGYLSYVTGLAGADLDAALGTQPARPDAPDGGGVAVAAPPGGGAAAQPPAGRRGRGRLADHRVRAGLPRPGSWRPAGAAAAPPAAGRAA